MNPWKVRKVPARTPESDAMSKDLKRRGFNFVGSTICYAFMQAVGMVNDHAPAVFSLPPAVIKPISSEGLGENSKVLIPLF